MKPPNQITTRLMAVVKATTVPYIQSNPGSTAQSIAAIVPTTSSLIATRNIPGISTTIDAIEVSTMGPLNGNSAFSTTTAGEMTTPSSVTSEGTTESSTTMEVTTTLVAESTDGTTTGSMTTTVGECLEVGA